jgi:hypothetical protein
MRYVWWRLKCSGAWCGLGALISAGQISCTAEVQSGVRGTGAVSGVAGASGASGATAAGGNAGTGGSGGSGGSGLSAGSGSGATGGAAGTASVDCAASIPSRLVLLGDFQFSNAARGLLGESAVNPLAPGPEAKPFSQKGVTPTTSLVDTRINWAATAAGSLADRFTEVTGCPETGDDACAQTFLAAFAARAFRRPVSAEEVTDLMAVYAVGKETDFETGVRLAVHAILSSPSFSTRTEYGVVGQDGKRRLTPHEIASELSFMLMDRGPDAELAAAADSGALADPTEIRRQVERLVALPEVQLNLTQTLMAAWGVSNLLGATKDETLFPEYTPFLQSSMYHETQLFIEQALWTSGGPVSGLLRSTTTFVNEALADYYGVTYPGSGDGTEYLPITMPSNRMGLLTQPAILAGRARSDNTSVVARGIFVGELLLCLEETGPPPEDLAGAIQDQLTADMSEKERAALRASNGVCAGCHAQIDPPGLLFENYDAIGRHRTQLDGATIDSSNDLTGLFSAGAPFNDALEFANAAASSPELVACLARHVLAYGAASDAIHADGCEVEAVIGSLAAPNPTMPQLIGAIAASPALVLRSEVQ